MNDEKKDIRELVITLLIIKGLRFFFFLLLNHLKWDFVEGMDLFVVPWDRVTVHAVVPRLTLCTTVRLRGGAQEGDHVGAL